MIPLIGTFDLVLPPIGPSECFDISFHDVVLPSYEDLLEATISGIVPLVDIAIVLSNHIISLNRIVPQFNLALIFLSSLISLFVDPQTLVLMSFQDLPLSCKLVSLMSFNSFVQCLTLRKMIFFPIDSIIYVNYDLPVEFDLTIFKSSSFGVD